MYATHLVCKGCGSQHPLEARFACDRCFGPLEAAYDRDAIAAGEFPDLTWDSSVCYGAGSYLYK